ncbi:MAG: YceD family protein [Rhodanobacteraceae bacterium]
MSVALSESVEVARMAAARQCFQGSLPLASMPRLCELLASFDGDVRYDLKFGKDALGTAILAVHVEAGLPLVCQRTLETYVQPAVVDQCLGLIADAGQEDALPEGCEPVLMVDGRIRLSDVIEDELILAVPLVPLSPGGAPLDYATAPDEIEPGPFAELEKLRKH